MVVQSAFERKCLMVEVPTELSVLTTGLCILFTLTNIPGNVLIILAVVFDPNKNLRTPFNWLVVNLATADLIVGLVTQPMAVYYHIKEALKTEITKEEKMIIHMSYFISCTASVLSLSSLAIERYLAVRKPNTYRTSVTNKRVMFTMAGIWLVSLGLPSIYFKVGIIYRFIFSNTSLVVACIIICVTYTFMLRKVKGTPRNPSNGNDRATQYTTSTASTENEHPPGHNSSAVMQNTPTSISTHMLEEKVTKMFIVVLIALISCYGPSNIMVYMITFCEACSCTTLNWLREFHFMFVLVNSSVNFFCYAFQSPRFRCTFKKLLRIKQGRNVAEFSNVNIAHSNSAINNTEETNAGEILSSKQLETEL